MANKNNKEEKLLNRTSPHKPLSMNKKICGHGILCLFSRLLAYMLVFALTVTSVGAGSPLPVLADESSVVTYADDDEDGDVTQYYYYTGGEQVFTVPFDAEYTFYLYGAWGGGENPDDTRAVWSNNKAIANPNEKYTSYDEKYISIRDYVKSDGSTEERSGNFAGKGGYTEYKVYLSKGTNIYINVGGQGGGYSWTADGYGGYNGGGSAICDASPSGAGGGGATSIAIESGTLASVLKSDGSGSADVLAVAGGGGGTDDITAGTQHNASPTHGGDGGGESGGAGTGCKSDGNYDVEGYGGAGGSEMCFAGYGYGESLPSDWGVDTGAGGGGYYGGLSGKHVDRNNDAAGGGGSGYINRSYNGYKGGTTVLGGNTTYGHGYVKITYKAIKYTDVKLYFYKDGVIDDTKTKTYSVQNGTIFNALEHVGDSSFDNCHYVRVDNESWTVDNEGTSTNVYYETNVLNIVYNGNGNDGGKTDACSAKYGSNATISSNGFTKTGYHFTGWNTAPDGSGTSYSAGSKFTAKPSSHGETLTLYAQWEIVTHKVTLNKGTGISSVTGDGSHNYGTNVTISAATEPGYTWEKWTGYADATENSYSFTMPDSDVTLTANATPNSYTVTFNGNGGTVSQSGKSGVTVTYDSRTNNSIPQITASRSGYQFMGWKSGTSADSQYIWDANGNAVKGHWSDNGSNGVWRHDGDVTAYAAWKDNTPPTVTASPDSTAAYSTSLKVTITADDNEALATDNSYQYCISTSASSPSGGKWTSYTNGSSFTIGSGLTGTYYLWVKHVKDTTGNVSVSSPNADYHRFGPYYFDNTAPDLNRVSNSYGWYTQGTSIMFDIADPHSGIASAILTDFNGIAVDDGDITLNRRHYFGTESVSLYCLTVSDKLGNTSKKPFIVKIDKNGDVVPDNAVWKGLGDVKLFAHWSANSYKVHFEKNDNDGGSTKASGNMQDVTMHYDKKEKLPANNFVRQGYLFTGWNESPDGTANNKNNYSDRAEVINLTLVPNGTVNLYAQWKAAGYTLTFDYNRPDNATHDIGGCSEKSRTVTFDHTIGRLPEPTLTGWVFEGWYIDGRLVSGSDIWRYTTNKTAVAKWRAAQYEVRLHSAVPEYALGTLTKTEPSGWTWKDDEYYSAMFVYDTESTVPAPENTYALTEYVISGWYSNELLTNYAGSGTAKWNLTTVNGGVVDLYPEWRDTSAPEINATPSRTVNPDADNDAVKSIDVTITITEQGSGLAPDNVYEYGFSTSADVLPSEWEKYSDTSSPESFTVTLPDLGRTLDGYYYLWLRQVLDRSGNSSVSPCAIATVKSCHVYGIYVFDNTAPTGTVKYVENNETLGLYDDTITDTPYAVMTIYDPYDEISGVESFTLHISDVSDSSNSADIPFTPDKDRYICRFNLYDSLADSENVEQVRMQVIARDKLGNTATLPVTQYDFGTAQDGTPTKADDIGYHDDTDSTANPGTLPDSPYYGYIRDNFRVEAYVENISYNASGTSFMGGQKGQLRIYVFGYVNSVSADFGSIKKFINPVYDTEPDLKNTVINPTKREYIYLHSFFVPLYSAYSTYTDTIAYGYKGGSCQHRNVVYDVNGTLTNRIKTILKYNAK